MFVTKICFRSQIVCNHIAHTVFVMLHVLQWTGYHDDLVTCCNISHDNSIIATGSDVDHILRLWDMRSGSIICSIEGT
jgi:WD40 repeat protein